MIEILVTSCFDGCPFCCDYLDCSLDADVEMRKAGIPGNCPLLTDGRAVRLANSVIGNIS